MNLKKIILVGCLLFISASRVTSAEEVMGVEVYPGAKHDAAISEFLKQMSSKSAAFRTSDGPEKVANFYRAKPSLKLVGQVTKEGAMFKKADVDVTIQSPYMDPNTGKMMKDTLISILIPPK